MSKIRRRSRGWKSWLSRSNRRPSERRQTQRRLFSETLEARMLLAADVTPLQLLGETPQYDLGHHNYAIPTDTNTDGATTAADALALVNALQTGGSRTLGEAEGSGSSSLKLDVNNDSVLSPVDLLQVVNEIEGEGEDDNALMELRVVVLGSAVEPVEQLINVPGLGEIAVDRDLIFTSNGTNTITRQDGGSWTADGFAVGGQLLVANTGKPVDINDGAFLGVDGDGNDRFGTSAPDVFDERNNGFYTITGVSDDVITVEEPFDTHVARDPADDPNESAEEPGAAAAKIYPVLTQASDGQTVNIALVSTDLRTLANPVPPADVNANNLPIGGPRPTGELGGPFQANAIVFLPDNVQPTTNDASHLNGFTLTAEEDFGTPGQVTLGGARQESLFASTGTGDHAIAVFPASISGAGTTMIDIGPTSELALDNLLNNSNSNAALCRGHEDPADEKGNCIGNTRLTGTTIDIVADIVAVDDGPFTFNEDSGPQTIDVLANDSVFNPPNTTPTITAVTQPSNANGSVTFTSSNVTFTPPAGTTGDFTFTYTITNGQNAFDTANVDVTIAPVNDPPINTVPGSQTIDEDVDLIFSSGNGNAITVSDSDGDVDVKVDLTPTLGTIIVPSPGSATVTSGANGLMSIEGTVSQVNNALSGLTYSPNSNASGTGSLRVLSSDPLNSNLNDDDTVNITINPINDGPINTVPGPQVLFNTQTLSFGTGAFQVSDVEASTLEVTLSVNNGTLSVGGAGSSSLTLNGLISSINSDLGNLVYDPTDSFVGDDTLTMTTSDLGATGAGGTLTDTDTVTLTVTPPQIPFAASDLYTPNEGTGSFVLSPNPVSNDLMDEGGALTVTGVNDSPASPTSTSGTLVYADGDFTYTPPTDPDFFGSDTFTYTIEHDPAPSSTGDSTSTGTITIDIQPVNDGPVNSVPGDQTVNEDNTLPISGLGVSDIDAGDGTLTVTLTVGNGTIDVPTTGGSVSSNGSANVTIDGTVSQINNTLGGVTYTPVLNFNGSDSLQINTNDNGNTGSPSGLSDTDTVNITVAPVNDAPVLVVPGNQANLIQDTPTTLSGFSVVDVDSTNVSVTLSTSGGTLSQTSFSGSPSSVTSALNNVTFTGPAGDFTVSVSVDDGASGTDSGSFSVNVLDTVEVNFETVLPPLVITGGADDGTGETSGQGNPITFVGVPFTIQTPGEPSMEVRTGSDGNLTGVTLTPGTTYTVTRPALPGTTDTGHTFTLTVNTDGSVSTSGDPAPTNIVFTPEFDQASEDLGLNESDGIIFGANSTGVVYGMPRGTTWSTYTQFQLRSVDVNAGTAVLWVHNGRSWFTANVSTASSTLTWRGHTDAERVFRVHGTPTSLPLVQSSAAQPSGEGESAAVDAAIEELFG